MQYRLSEIRSIARGVTPMTLLRFDPNGALEYEEEGLTKQCIDQNNEWICFAGEIPSAREIQSFKAELAKRGIVGITYET